MNLPILPGPWLIAACLSGLLAPFAPTQTEASILQDASSRGAQSGTTAEGKKTSNEVLVEYYTPLKAEINELRSTMDQIFRFQGKGANFLTFGEILLIQASADVMPEALSLVKQTDMNYLGVSERTTAAGQQLFKLKYVSLATAEEALRFMDQKYLQRPNGWPVLGAVQVGLIQERNMVMLRGESKIVDLARSILEQVDVAPPSLMITCYLIQGSDGASSSHLPAELVKHLANLVPYAGFQLVSSGMLPSNASERLGLDVELDDDAGEFSLTMKPSAFDEDHGLLELSSITFQLSLNAATPNGKKRNRRSFTTSTSLATDKFTVLGAVGADPVFVVVRMTKL